MRIRSYAVIAFALCTATWGCSKEKKKGEVSASLMKSETVDASLALDNALTESMLGGSTEQSFTPKSLKVPIYRVALCSGSSSCEAVYSCSGTATECGVELSDIDAFVDAINASAKEVDADSTFDQIGVEFCAEGVRDGIQQITLSGTVRIQGVDYATDPTAGLVPGTDAKETTIALSGGCARYYPLTPSINVGEGDSINVKLFFDASYYAYAGIAGSSMQHSYSDTGGCAGDESAYVCPQVMTVVATVDAGNPVTEHYLLADTSAATGGSADSAPTSSVVLYYSSTGPVIGGVQNSYLLSGSNVSWGQRMGGGLTLVPKDVDVDTVSFGEPGGSVMLVNWFKSFKRASHTGTYTYDENGSAVEGDYKATKF